MKTKEFIKRVEELGFKVNKGITRICIVSEGLTVATISTERVHYINCFCFVDIEWKNQDKLFNLIVEYAKTPIEDREEEKKYYLKHRWIKNSINGKGYLNCFIHDDIMRLSSTLQDKSAKTQFTRKEIEEIKKKFDTDLKDFELVEVENENKHTSCI